MDSISATTRRAELLLQRQLKDISKNPHLGFSAGLKDDSDMFKWEIVIPGPEGTPYYDGFFKAEMVFPHDYPVNPPSVKFTSEIWHPNIYPNGNVCISILHPPGDDPHGYELARERWLPIHTVETIMLSISPNDESAANVDAAIEWRDNVKQFNRRVSQIVRRSQEMFWN